jgi:16S rRNA (cytidine1402-2'-O)-methyltransferase
MPSEDHTPGTLYIVATPIGNLGDVSQRMRDTLAAADVIVCEDTRHTRKLLSHLHLSAKLISCHRDNEHAKATSLVHRLIGGESIALVSDAGTPGISDPGSAVVRAARQAMITIVPVAGPSALSAAVSVAGLEESSFYFGGFLSAKKSERRKQLTSLSSLHCALIFYEAPHRIAATLQDCFDMLGDRYAQLFRELTKLHEEHRAGQLSALIAQIPHAITRGEFVLIINGCKDVAEEEQPTNLEELILWHRDHGSSLKDTAKQLAADFALPKSQVYQQALSVWGK